MADTHQAGAQGLPTATVGGDMSANEQKQLLEKLRYLELKAELDKLAQEYNPYQFDPTNPDDVARLTAHRAKSETGIYHAGIHPEDPSFGRHFPCIECSLPDEALSVGAGGSYEEAPDKLAHIERLALNVINRYRQGKIRERRELHQQLLDAEKNRMHPQDIATIKAQLAVAEGALHIGWRHVVIGKWPSEHDANIPRVALGTNRIIDEIQICVFSSVDEWRKENELIPWFPCRNWGVPQQPQIKFKWHLVR